MTCTDSGGNVTTGTCCLSADDFPNTCLIGTCGCSPDSSHEINICECPQDTCFDGTECVPFQNPATTCTESGGNVTTGTCCLSAEDFPNTCLIGACGCGPDSSHEINVCNCPQDTCFDGTECVSFQNPAATCTDSGGDVTTGTCCQSAEDFPNTCLIGACGCGPNSSHEINVCECPRDTCFDGTECVPFQNPTATCTDSGGNVTIGTCCQSVEDFPNTCLIGACGCGPDSSHEINICECPRDKCFDGMECVSFQAMTCTESGGNVMTGTCCQSAEDFPNTCLIGACGCGPDSSHEINVCECPQDTCFDGTECVSFQNPATTCTDSGGNVTTGTCCLSAENFPNTCLIGACGCGPDSSHEINVCDCPLDTCFNGTECISVKSLVDPAGEPSGATMLTSSKPSSAVFGFFCALAWFLI